MATCPEFVFSNLHENGNVYFDALNLTYRFVKLTLWLVYTYLITT